MAQSHSLRFNGAAFSAEGELINPDQSVTSGVGAAMCACGAISEELPSGAARRRWFAEHKKTPLQEELPVAEEAAEATVEAELDDIIGDVEPEPEPAKAAKKAPAKKTTKAKPAAKAKKADKAPHPLGDGEAVVPFTTEVADSMWRFLGRDGAKAMLAKLYPSVEVKVDAKAHALILTGSDPDVTAASQEVTEYWAEAIEAVKEYKANDKKFLARPKAGLEGRKASYFMVGEFYVNYATKYAKAHAA